MKLIVGKNDGEDQEIEISNMGEYIRVVINYEKYYIPIEVFKGLL